MATLELAELHSGPVSSTADALNWLATPKTALGDKIGTHTDALARASITKALVEARAQQGSQQWYCGGPRTSFVYKPPHHRYRTDKTISKILYNADGTVGCERIPANVSNTRELWETWAPNKQAGLPPKLSFMGVRQERNLSPELTGSQMHGKWGGPLKCHEVRIDYDTRSQAVTVEADGVVLQQQVQTRLGLPLEPWDLHVGAVLDILGQKTRGWLVGQADRLVRTRKLLESELSKFMHVEAVQERYARGCMDVGDCALQPLNPRNPKFTSRGDLCLRRLVEEVEELRMRLAQFRRQLPQYGAKPAPEDGVLLKGPFDTPADWDPKTFADSQRPPHCTNPVHDEEHRKSPKDYLEWLASIPLASTAALAPLSHMGPAKVDIANKCAVRPRAHVR